MCWCDKERVEVVMTTQKPDSVLVWINWDLIRIPIPHDEYANTTTV